MSGVWRQEQPMHEKRERFGSAVMDSCVFVAGGFTEDGRPTSHVEVCLCVCVCVCVSKMGGGPRTSRSHPPTTSPPTLLRHNITP